MFKWSIIWYVAISFVHRIVLLEEIESLFEIDPSVDFEKLQSKIKLFVKIRLFLNMAYLKMCLRSYCGKSFAEPLVVISRRCCRDLAWFGIKFLENL